MAFVYPGKSMESVSYDVVVCGGGTGGVFAAIAAARNGANTVLLEQKGYVGGIAAEGGCGLHSFYNVWKPHPGVEKRKVVRGIPAEFIDRLTKEGGASGHNETAMFYEYDSDALCVDVEIYKFVALQMLREAGVHVLLNTTIADAVAENGTVTGVIISNHEGMKAIEGKMFIDATGYGDVCASAGANYIDPNDYDVANSIGVSGVDIDAYYDYLEETGALNEYAKGSQGIKKDRIIRVSGDLETISPELAAEAKSVGLNAVTTTLYDNYFMFLKVNYRMMESPTKANALSDAEFELRRRQRVAIDIVRRMIPGAENAFIARSAPSVTIRRGRCIECEYALSVEEITGAKHFEDDIFSYGFHDNGPRLSVGKGDTYGVPFRAIQVKNFKNLMAIGMMITPERSAHMSTRNTVSCMAMGQASGTAAALCCGKDISDMRDLPYADLYTALKAGNVWFDQEHTAQ